MSFSVFLQANRKPPTPSRGLRKNRKKENRYNKSKN